jgi:hypothetical protein
MMSTATPRLFHPLPRRPLPTRPPWYVNEHTGVDADGYGRAPDKPFATVDYARSQCSADKGYVIFVYPAPGPSVWS